MDMPHLLAKRQKILLIFASITLLFGFGSLGIFCWWTFYPYKLLEPNLPYKVKNHEIKAGDTLEYVVDYCKYTDETPDIKREYVDGIIFESQSTRANVKKGCGKITVTEKIPDTLPSGNYIMRITATYHPNPIREIVYINETETFTVVRDDE